MWETFHLPNFKFNGISHATILLFTRDGHGSKISRTSTCNYRSTNDTSDEFNELCRAVIDGNKYLFEKSKDLVPGFLQDNGNPQLFSSNPILKFDSDRCFCPFDLDLMYYVNFLHKCRSLLLDIEKYDEMRFHLFMYQPILFYLHFLECVNDWLDLQLRNESKKNNKNMSVFDCLVKLSEFRKRFLKFNLNHELSDGYHRTLALNIIMKECSLQKDDKSLQKNLDVSSLKKIYYDDHYIFTRLSNVFVVVRSDDANLCFRDYVPCYSSDRNRLDEFCHIKILSREKNNETSRHQPTSFHSATEDLVDMALKQFSSKPIHTYAIKKDSDTEMITNNYKRNQYEDTKNMWGKRFEKNNLRDGLFNMSFKLKRKSYMELFMKHYLQPALEKQRSYLISLFEKLIENPNLAIFFAHKTTYTARSYSVDEVYTSRKGITVLTPNGRVCLEHELIFLFRNDMTKNIIFKKAERNQRIEQDKYIKDEYKIASVQNRLKNDTVFKKSEKNTEESIDEIKKVCRIITVYSVMIVDLIMVFTDDKDSIIDLKSYIERNKFVS